MKITYRILFNIILVFSIPFISIGQNIESKIQELFPQPENEYTIQYITLPYVISEENLKVEVYVGEDILSGYSNYILNGVIKEYFLEGYGYPYYTVKSEGLSVSNDAVSIENNVKKFVYMPPKLLPYNSQVPLVFYLPKNLKVRYKIYNNDNTLYNANSYGMYSESTFVKYRFLENHYIKSGIYVPILSSIDNQNELDALYWHSKSSYNYRSDINFDNEFVIPIVKKESYVDTKINLVSIFVNTNGILQVLYKVKYGKVLSYPNYPSLGIILDKKFQGKVSVNELK
jgi:ecotin